MAHRRNAPFAIAISSAVPAASEKNLLLGSWRHSLQDSPFGGSMPARAFSAWFEEICDFYLDLESDDVRLPRGVTLLTIRMAERASFIAGWLLLDRGVPGVTALVYCYCKKASQLRNCGLASLLISSALDMAGDDEVVHCLSGPREWQKAKIDAYGFPYRSIEDFLRADRNAEAA